MLRCLYESRRQVALVGWVLWAVTSTTAVAISWPQLFAAMGAFALSLGFGIFLTDRFQMTEERRYWDSLLETPQRLTRRYLKRLRREDGVDPRALDDLEAQIEDSFDSLLSSEAHEKTMETYRLEMGFSIIGKLQWGFGAIIVGVLHG